MNAMSALYHIAQNDPPVLADPETDDGPTCWTWSREFKLVLGFFFNSSFVHSPLLWFIRVFFSLIWLYGTPQLSLVATGPWQTDRDKLTANKLNANQLIPIGWEGVHRIILVSSERSCPNPHFVKRSLVTFGSRSVRSRSVCRCQLIWLGCYSVDVMECLILVLNDALKTESWLFPATQNVAFHHHTGDKLAMAWITRTHFDLFI